MSSLSDILSSVQNGVVAINNLSDQMVGSFTNIHGQLPGFVLATQFAGVVPDGVTPCDTGIANAIAYCVANKKTLCFQDGNYAHTNTIAWAIHGLRVIALGDNVIFSHKGAGIAHDFNGLTTGASINGVFQGVFGWPNRILLNGNPSGATSIAAYINNWHQGRMMIAGRDADVILFGNNTGGAAASVSSIFDVRVSANGDGSSFASTPLSGLFLSEFFNCIFNQPIMEQCGRGGNFAVQVLNSHNNIFLGGTIESNLAGGILVDANCANNTFLDMDIEVNGASFDVFCQGAANIFQNLVTAGSSNGSLVTGALNRFESSILQSFNNTGTANAYENCTFTTTFADSGLNTTVIRSTGLAVQQKFFNGQVLTISGSGAPTVLAPQGSVYSRVDGGSTNTRMYINTNSSTAWTPVLTAT